MAVTSAAAQPKAVEGRRSFGDLIAGGCADRGGERTEGGNPNRCSDLAGSVDYCGGNSSFEGAVLVVPRLVPTESISCRHALLTVHASSLEVCRP